MQTSVERKFQAERRASEKVLRQECWLGRFEKHQSSQGSRNRVKEEEREEEIREK